MQKRWRILPFDPETVQPLQEALGINEKLCRILAQRGYITYELARSFFRPTLKMLHDPWLMKDMQKAVDRIEAAFIAKEKILVFGDYDVDGTASVSMMYSFLCEVYISDLVGYYVPHRYREGYGVSQAGIDFAKKNGFTLIISLDCGIKSIDLVDYANKLGIHFIICDHHLPGKKIPNAAAVLDPKQKDCGYPFKELCGCGVGFKLISAIAEKNGLGEELAYKYLDLVATAIAADIVPLVDENRVLSFFGLKKINSNPNVGIAALMKLSAAKVPMTISHVVFLIAPRVNAAGRMDSANKAVQLFIEKDEQTAFGYAELLHSDNIERKDADKSITEEALEMLANDPSTGAKKTTVLFREHWHKGVVGIVASRLIESYYRPTVVLTQNGEIITGSARSVPGFNLYEAIYACRDHLLAYGGHFAAAGVSLHKSELELFTEKFETVVAGTIEPGHLVPEITIDSEVCLNEITPKFYKIIRQMEPFGPENMKPIFIAKNVRDTGYSRVVKERHIRFVVKQDNTVMSGIGFEMADMFPLLQHACDIVFQLEENEWNGNTSLQLKVIDLRPAADEIP